MDSSAAQVSAVVQLARRRLDAIRPVGTSTDDTASRSTPNAMPRAFMPVAGSRRNPMYMCNRAARASNLRKVRRGMKILQTKVDAFSLA